jgi:hypothetical protein
MNLKRWSCLILMTGLILALNPLNAQAEPYPTYHYPHGNAYGWYGPGPHGFDRHHRHFRRFCGGPGFYAGPPPVAYVAPVAPVIGIPYMQPQPFFPQPAPPGFSGQLNFSF